MDKEKEKNEKNTYDDGNIPETDLPGQNHYGGDKTGGYDDSNSNPSGEDHLVWVTPPVLLADAEGLKPRAADGI